jgi:hypothetical protein
VNSLLADGCEAGYFGGAHTQSTATYLGSHRCFDDEGGSFSSTILSDNRAHENPSVPGFITAVGAAPQWWRISATGGSCTNDPVISLTMSGGTSGCYRLTLITNLGQWSSTVSGGSASISLGSGAYSDGTDVYIVVEKICNTNVREAASYTVTYHL